MLLLIQI